VVVSWWKYLRQLVSSAFCSSFSPPHSRKKKDSPLPLQLLIQAINQHTHAIKPQPLAFMMKIKVRVMHPGVGQGVQRALISLLHGLLVPRLVDQVDEVLVPVVRDLRIKVSLEGFGLSMSVWRQRFSESAENES